jgi:predicted exporter
MKTILDLIKGTLTGVDGEGSAKRISMLHMLLLITLLHFVYAFAFTFIVCVASPNVTPSVIHTQVISYFEEVDIIDCIIFLTLAGYAVIESITKLVQVFKGQKSE